MKGNEIKAIQYDKDFYILNANNIYYLSQLMNSTSIAQGEVTSSEELVGDGVNKIDGKYYVPPQSDFMINYTINNGSEHNISQIKRMKPNGGGSSQGSKSIFQPDKPIMPGQSNTFSGENLRLKKCYILSPLKYTIE